MEREGEGGEPVRGGVSLSDAHCRTAIGPLIPFFRRSTGATATSSLALLAGPHMLAFSPSSYSLFLVAPIRGQDDQLTDIEKGIDNVTAMGKQINDHLVEDVSVGRGDGCVARAVPGGKVLWASRSMSIRQRT